MVPVIVPVMVPVMQSDGATFEDWPDFFFIFGPRSEDFQGMLEVVKFPVKEYIQLRGVKETNPTI